jgi:hypothetical protein
VIVLTGGLGRPRAFCSDAFSSSFLFESIFGADGCFVPFDAGVIGGAFGFGVSGSGTESVAARVGAVAIVAPFVPTICRPAGGVAGFGVSAGCAEPVEAGADGAAAIGCPSGLIACEAADGAAVFGA